MLVARMFTDDINQPRWQNIKLAQGPRSARTRYLVCPLTLTRCDVLYFRNGIFASREAQRLFNRSQRALQSNQVGAAAPRPD